MKRPSPSPMLLEETVRFLRTVPPFQFLDDKDLRAVARNLSLEFYPKNTVILKQEGPPSDSLRIIKKGGVKLTIGGGGEDVVIDYRGAGETFGFLSLVGRERVRSNVVAADDTICYLLGKEMVKTLLDTHPAVTEHFLRSHVARYIDRTYREMQDRAAFAGGSDRLLFMTAVGDLSIKDVVTAPASATIQETARLMAGKHISSVVITDEGGAVGIVTDRDLREKVVARGRSVLEPVGNIMSRDLVRIDSRDLYFEAVLRLIRHGIHHLIVMREGKLAGVLTNHDLMLLQGSSPLSLAKEIESQHSLEGLARVSKKVDDIAGLLLKEGARAGSITTAITELNDRIVRKVIALAVKSRGAPPVPFCWVGFGSEGRKEQVFRADQDNGIIYEDPPAAGEEQAKRYFAGLAGDVRDGLAACGFPPCPAGYMASNPRWCRPLGAWKRSVSGWIAAPDPQDLVDALVVLDLRPLDGEFALAASFRDHLAASLRDNDLFLGYLANMAVRNTPPLGFFNTFVVERSGAHKNKLNLKVKGTAPIVDIVRLFALERDVRETSTRERIEALRGSNTIVDEYADDLTSAFDFVMQLRLHHQYEAISRGTAPDNFIDPGRLSNLEKRLLKEAFQLVAKVHGILSERTSTQVASRYFYS